MRLADERPVIYYDQIGCGRSDRPDDPSLWTLATFADEIDTVREALGLDRMHLFGQSAGGWIAIEYALRAPPGLASLHLANTCSSIPLFERGVAQLRAALPGGAGAVIDSCESAGITTDPEYLAAVGLFNRLHFTGTDDVPARVLRRGAGTEPGDLPGDGRHGVDVHRQHGGLGRHRPARSTSTCRCW